MAAGPDDHVLVIGNQKLERGAVIKLDFGFWHRRVEAPNHLERAVALLLIAFFGHRGSRL